MLGLGSSDYSKYQGNPRYVYQSLTSIGANFFYYRGEADEAISLEETIEPWLEGLHSNLKT
jgi:sulfite reductase alpha subunit-like flavoprotein